MRILLGTAAYNKHVQHIAKTFYEADVLYAFHTALVDNYRHKWARKIRNFLKDIYPGLDNALARRFVSEIPSSFIHKHWFFEGARIALSRLQSSYILQDMLWEHSEHLLDRLCSRMIIDDEITGFFGIEHGCLLTLQVTKSLRKKSTVAFLSPHHTFLKKWVYDDYGKFPELLDSYAKRLMRTSIYRNERLDEEAKLADSICTNSELTAKTLIDAGVRPEKIFRVKLGAPPAIPDDRLPSSCSKPLKFVYSGPISVRKGAHYLLHAWKKLNPSMSAELHIYGRLSLPKKYIRVFDNNVFFHGPVSQKKLFDAYRRATALIFPTLCDGFGLVIAEAFANGLPVITTKNAGAAEIVEEGKNGFIVPPSDSNALAGCIEWCIRHPERLLEMRRHALVTARYWTWERFRGTLLAELRKASLFN